MLEYLLRYALFLAQTLTFVVAIGFILTLIVSSVMRLKGSGSSGGHLKIRKINEYYDDLRDTLQEALLDEKEFKQWQKQQEKEKKAKHKAEHKKQSKKGDAAAIEPKNRVFVLRFDGDTDANQVENLREEISAVLSVATPKDEVVLQLESPGGVVHGYGLCASQLKRLRDKNIPLTVVIDKVAASGGYLMACVADKIIAAPFAIIGSIGVLMQIPNVHRLLKKHDVDFELITAGEYKRTLTVFGENTDKARKKAQEEVNDIHTLFKQFVLTGRPQLNIDDVATGEFWFGERALELNLVDSLSTSDDYLMEKHATCDLLEVCRVTKPSLRERLTDSAASIVEKATHRLINKHPSSWQR